MVSDRVKKVGLLGGSFNPPHIGHLEICRHLLDHKGCDQVRVIPCFQHPFGKELASFEDRLAMCRFAFQELGGRVRVDDVERSLGGVSHTVRTIQHLKFTYPDKDFTLVVGTDVGSEKGDWKDFDRIKEMVSIFEIPRGKTSFITDISSTEIRRKIKEGEEFGAFVAEPVSVYIITRGLYH